MSETNKVQVTPLANAGLHDLRMLLNEAGLPTQDLLLPDRRFFRFDEKGELLGFGGIEGIGTDRLLRFLVVMEGRRGLGLGRRMLEMLEHIASADGALRLHILTNTAPDFFSTNGYRVALRDEAPESISNSVEFKSLCPDSATYMVKDIHQSAD